MYLKYFLLIFKFLVYGFYIDNNINAKWGLFALYIVLVNDQSHVSDYMGCGSFVTQEGAILSFDDHRVMWALLDADYSDIDGCGFTDRGNHVMIRAPPILPVLRAANRGLTVCRNTAMS